MACVIGLKGKRDTHQALINAGTVKYCGRQCTLGGWVLEGSIWANPFRVGRDVPDATMAVKAYYEWFTGVRPKPVDAPYYIPDVEVLIGKIHELRGLPLACWCRVKGNEPCHCDVPLWYANGILSDVLRQILTQ